MGTFPSFTPSPHCPFLGQIEAGEVRELCGHRLPRAYLEVHQQEQEKLQGQIRESKRNSRLVSEELTSCMSWFNALCSCGVEGLGRASAG